MGRPWRGLGGLWELWRHIGSVGRKYFERLELLLDHLEAIFEASWEHLGGSGRSRRRHGDFSGSFNSLFFQRFVFGQISSKHLAEIIWSGGSPLPKQMWAVRPGYQQCVCLSNSTLDDVATDSRIPLRLHPPLEQIPSTGIQ